MITDRIVFTFIYLWSTLFIFFLLTQRDLLPSFSYYIKQQQNNDNNDIVNNHYSHDLNDGEFTFDIRKHQGTKGSYPIKSSTSPLVKIPDKCELIQLQLVARHGTRYPTSFDIESFDSLVEKFKEVPKTRNWNNPYNFSQSSLLTKEGEEELYLLGKRSRSRYRDFWQNITYDPTVIKFQSSSVSRTGLSGIAYSLGLLTGYGELSSLKLQPVYIYSLPRELDTDLTMHRACPKWLSEADKTVNRRKLEEENKYLKFNVTSMAEHLSKKLNIKPSLEPRYMEYIYRMCIFDLTLLDKDYGHNSGKWCDLLGNDDILSTEYFHDIGYYHVYSYGTPLNTRLACRFFTGFINEVEDYVFNKSKTKAILRFAHAETIFFIVTMLDMFKDEFRLTFNLTSNQASSRKFRTSKIAPFGSNVYFEIYQCNRDDNGNNGKNHESITNSIYIRMLLNEKIVNIPNCKGELCAWNDFKILLGDNIDCDFNELCKLE